MIQKEAVIQNSTGFHIRPAQLFTEMAGGYQSTVKIKVADGGEVDGKSILGLMTLGLGKGAVITIIADGPDEDEAVNKLVQLVGSGFGEA